MKDIDNIENLKNFSFKPSDKVWNKLSIDLEANGQFTEGKGDLKDFTFQPSKDVWINIENKINNSPIERGLVYQKLFLSACIITVLILSSYTIYLLNKINTLENSIKAGLNIENQRKITDEQYFITTNESLTKSESPILSNSLKESIPFKDTLRFATYSDEISEMFKGSMKETDFSTNEESVQSDNSLQFEERLSDYPSLSVSDYAPIIESSIVNSEIPFLFKIEIPDLKSTEVSSNELDILDKKVGVFNKEQSYFQEIDFDANLPVKHFNNYSSKLSLSFRYSYNTLGVKYFNRNKEGVIHKKVIQNIGLFGWYKFNKFFSLGIGVRRSVFSINMSNDYFFNFDGRSYDEIQMTTPLSNNQVIAHVPQSTGVSAGSPIEYSLNFTEKISYIAFPVFSRFEKDINSFFVSASLGTSFRIKQKHELILNPIENRLERLELANRDLRTFNLVPEVNLGMGYNLTERLKFSIFVTGSKNLYSTSHSIERKPNQFGFGFNLEKKL